MEIWEQKLGSRKPGARDETWPPSNSRPIMWGLTYHSLVENTFMTKRELCAHKTNYIYMYVSSIDVVCFYDYSIWC
jgi:hypothetical protein